MARVNTGRCHPAVLSNDTGTIAVRWRRSERADGPWARVDWVESGGPPVTSIGENGFGSSLIERSVEHDLAGTMSVQFRPTGMDCVIEFPLEERGRESDGEHGPKGAPPDAEEA